MKRKISSAEVNSKSKKTTEDLKTKRRTISPLKRENEIAKAQTNERNVKKVPLTETDNAKHKPRQVEETPHDKKRTVFVGNLPVSTTSKEVKKMFKVFGDVETVRLRSMARAHLKLPRKISVIRRDAHEERPNINAYVKFKEESSAKKSLKLNGEKFKEFTLRVDLLLREKEEMKTNSVFVGNLPYNITEDQIRSHFTDCGPIENVRVVRDSYTGLGKGFGFVEFKNQYSVELAFKLNDSVLCNRSVRVKNIEHSSKNMNHKDSKKKKKVNELKVTSNTTKKGHQRKLKRRYSQKGNAKPAKPKVKRKRISTII